jgi:phosphopantothenoylcysteine decarboxylase/phosphopantothenate--cysteine ligase
VNKHILLAAGASAALHKSCDLASKLAQEGHAVRVVLTPRAAQLVSPQLFEAVTGEPAFTDEFGPARRGAMDHIELARWAQALVVAPCPADLVSRLALGMADDLVTTVALALAPKVPKLVCPAMNPHMLAAAPVQRNLEQLRRDGWRVLEPGAGHMACGDEGRGRLSEPAEILAALAEILG